MRFSYDGQSARNAGHRIDNFPFHEVEQECDILRSFGGGTREDPPPSPYCVGQARDRKHERTFRGKESQPLGPRDIADRIEDHVKTILDVRDRSLSVVNRPNRPEPSHEIVVPRRRDSGHRCAEMRGELHGCRADSARSPIDEHAVTAPHSRTIAEKVQGGGAPEENRRSILVAYPRRNGGQ